MKETWKRYKDTEYLVSTIGNVWSEKTKRILSSHDDSRGYLAVPIDGIKLKIHRLVAIVHIPNDRPEAVEVNHKDGAKINNSKDNLEWLTHEENMQHAWQNDLCKIGSDCSQAILDEEDVENIKKLFVQYKLNNTEIGLLFGVVKGTISKIRSLHTWKAVRPDLIFDPSSPNKTNLKKLCGEDIPFIRNLHTQGYSLAEIGRRFGVHSGTVSGIISGRTWKNY